jgi:hypothetical protein
MKTETELRENIMRRVWMAYFVREATRPMILAVAFAVSLFVLGRLVFVAKVFENAALKHDAFGYIGYMLDAFIGTQFIVQLIVVLSAVLFAFILKDAVLTLARSRLAGA